jgi:hypothetical protein
MKRLITLWMMSLLMVLTFPAMAAMSTSKMRQHSRFLTDRMAYELNLSSSQYDDVYEVNYDFLSRTRYLIDDVVAGYTSALDEYYDYLDVRNDDLRWILTSSQYRRFLDKEYFYRPIYTTTAGSWGFRIYQVYTDITHFYFSKPSHYSSYKGAHYRSNFNNVSYYKTQHSSRYKNNDVYRGDFTMGKTMKKESSQNKNNDVNMNRPNSSSSHGNGNVNTNGNGNVNTNGNGNVNTNGNGNVSTNSNSNRNQNSVSGSSSKRNSSDNTTAKSNRGSRSNSSSNRSNSSSVRSNSSSNRSNNSTGNRSNSSSTRSNNGSRRTR